MSSIQEDKRFADASGSIEVLKAFISFVFLYQHPYDPLHCRNYFEKRAKTAIIDKLNLVKEMLSSNEDPRGTPVLRVVKNLFDDFVCWDLLYRRFKWGITMNNCVFEKTAEHDKAAEFKESLSIVEVGNSFKQLGGGVTAITETEALKIYKQHCKFQTDIEKEIFSYISVDYIERKYFDENRKVKVRK